MAIPRKRPRKGKVFAAPQFSGRRYIRLDAGKVHLFRYYLEAHDNLGIMTVADHWAAVLLMRYSPHQEREALEFLRAMEHELGAELLPDISVLPTQEGAQA